MKERYSIAIYPSAEVMSLIKDFKDLLARIIGWYPSRNSNGHITIMEFEASKTELVVINNFLQNFCSAKKPFLIALDGFKNYLNGAFFIAPDQKSKATTKVFMKQLHQGFPIKALFTSSDPHLSIARQLDKQNIKIANQLFQDVKTAFKCNSIVLRELKDVGEGRKQFVIIEKYLLDGIDDFSNAYGQLSLGF